ncbi:hypothetical protein MUK42_02405 [Musa troglodytarum]|uniref:Ubiquitin-like domain-containing protein n=1 Tax=Musa troglodytarum TaxID=320322 RepID=A0A9E7EP62_9LILI|nr:hypothetical protein MUK42_02405 [Musa troglodytarum]
MLADLPRAPSIIHRGLGSWCVNASRAILQRLLLGFELMRNVIGIPFDPLFVSRILPPLPRPNPHTPPPARDLFRFSASPFPLDSATKDWRRQMPEEDLVELKFRLCDGSDIGPIRYSSASTVAMLKERIISEWPRDKKIIPGVANDVKLISGGKILENNKTIAQCRSPFGELPAGVITMHVVVQPSLTKIKTEKKVDEFPKKTTCSCSIL